VRTPGAFSRRHLLTRIAPSALALAAVRPRIGRAAQARNLEVLWWGEQEAAGVERWMTDTIGRFTAETGIPITSRLLDNDEVAEGFTRAAEAGGHVPDVQFLWNGIFLMQAVWRGLVMPLNGVVSPTILKRSGATTHSVFEGKQYRVGFYLHGFGIAFNKRLLDRAGLNADQPPRTWDGFLNACDRLRAAGIVPFAGGTSDGFWGDWFLTSALPQQLDSTAEALQLFIGNLDWREPRYHDHWVRLEELSTRGFFNDDITDIGMYDALKMFERGEAAFCMSITASLPHAQSQLGADSVGFMVMPVFGQGKMAGQPIIDKQGFGIPTRAADPATAARFMEFMHSKERLQAMWTLSHQIPADEAFDTSIVDDPLMRSVVERWVTGTPVLTVEDLMPVEFWTDAMFVASQQIVAGSMTGRQAGDLAHRVTESWRASASPETVNNYAIWGNSLEG
jgi:raffinose/stachyose/melibiose transport system substrate-binding protein